MLPSCVTGQHPFGIAKESGPGLYNGSGDSIAEACRNFAVAYGQSYKSSTLNGCIASLSLQEYPVVQVCTPDASLSDLGVTPVNIAYTVGWAFGVVLLGFLFGYVLGLALGLIKKV